MALCRGPEELRDRRMNQLQKLYALGALNTGTKLRVVRRTENWEIEALVGDVVTLFSLDTWERKATAMVCRSDGDGDVWEVLLNNCEMAE